MILDYYSLIDILIVIIKKLEFNVKKALRKIHLYLGLFTLPMGLILAITGVLFIADFDEDTGATINEYTSLEIAEEGKEVEFLKKWTAENNISMPRTNEVMEHKGSMIVGTPLYNITVTVEDDKTSIETIKRSLLGVLFLTHEAKDLRWYINILSVLLGISMMTFYISGIVIASFKKTVDGKKVVRKEYVVTLILGFIITILLITVSVV